MRELIGVLFYIMIGVGIFAILIFCEASHQDNAKNAWLSGKCNASYTTCMEHWR
jgi:hypothetical protein